MLLADSFFIGGFKIEIRAPKAPKKITLINPYKNKDTVSIKYVQKYHELRSCILAGEIHQIGSRLYKMYKDREFELDKLLNEVFGADGMNLLHIAAYRGDLTLIKTLFHFGAKFDVQSKDEFGYTALHYAACNKAIPELNARMLCKPSEESGSTYAVVNFLATRQSVNVTSTTGKTPLICAARYGSFDIMLCLIKANAKFLDSPKIQTELLQLATKHGYSKIINFCIACGAIGEKAIKYKDFQGENREINSQALDDADYNAVVLFNRRQQQPDNAYKILRNTGDDASHKSYLLFSDSQCRVGFYEQIFVNKFKA